MKNVIKVAVLVMVAAVSVTLSAQTPKQTAPTKETPKQTAPAKETPAPAKEAPKDAPKVDAAPCKAGEVLKDAKKPFDAKKNPCVKAKK